MGMCVQQWSHRLAERAAATMPSCPRLVREYGPLRQKPGLHIQQQHGTRRAFLFSLSMIYRESPRGAGAPRSPSPVLGKKGRSGAQSPPGRGSSFHHWVQPVHMWGSPHGPQNSTRSLFSIVRSIRPRIHRHPGLDPALLLSGPDTSLSPLCLSFHFATGDLIIGE